MAGRRVMKKGGIPRIDLRLRRTSARIRAFIDQTIIPMVPGTRLGSGALWMDEDEAKYEPRYSFDKKGVTITHPKGMTFRIDKHRHFAKKATDWVKYVMDQCIDEEVYVSEHWQETTNGIVNSAVARFASQNHHRRIQSIISLYTSWASQTYEGNRISHCSGVDPKLDPIALLADPSKEDIDEFYGRVCDIDSCQRDDELKILGSGSNSVMLLDADGIICGIKELQPLSSKKAAHIKAPLSFCHVAGWAERGRTAVSLTRNGEILVFSNRKLQFAKRRGGWRYFPHTSISNDFIAIPGVDIAETLKEAVHLTALDVAFTRGGACIGIVKPEPNFFKLIEEGCELLDKPLHRTVVGRKTFMELERSVRAELCAIDGATILDPEGNILCVGAILKTAGNAAGGGGRTAAARAISQFGIGIKVSNDGNIVAFPHGWSKGDEIGWG